MIAIQSSKALWYLTRSTGFVALVLLTASVFLGIVEVSRWSSPRVPRFVVAAMHKNVSLVVLVFLAIHIVSAVADNFAPIHWIDVIVPFQSPYRPLWLGLGTVAVDLLLALTATSLLRNRLGYRAWRAVHWMAYACWPVALLHGLGTGSDTRVGWALVLSLGCLAIVLGALTWRVITARGIPKQRRVRIGLAIGTVVVAILGWTFTGPTRAGWAKRSGTPTALLAGTNHTATPSRSTTLHTPFDASFVGTYRQSVTSGGRTTVTIDGSLSGGTSARMKLVLEGNRAPGGGVQMDRSTATLGSRSKPALYEGTVVALVGTNVTAKVRTAAGKSVTLSARLNIDSRHNVVTGPVSARIIRPESQTTLTIFVLGAFGAVLIVIWTSKTRKRWQRETTRRLRRLRVPIK
jgi:sulfoxide reductase heme-binding subunit YedZ